MLLRFAVENHLSIRDRQELSFAASSLKDRGDGLIPCAAVGSRAVVPAVVIYGANASGKSNFINAVSTMKVMVLWSQTMGKPGGGAPRRAFLLDPSFSQRPSCFEIDFLLDDIRYHYGFTVSDEAFTSEWLYEIPKAHRRKLYERVDQTFDFGRWLKGQNHAIARLTRSNSLFLSAAAQNGHELLSRIYGYFQSIVFSGPVSVPGIEASSRVIGDGIDERVIEFLQTINTGVVGYQRKKFDVPETARAIYRELHTVLDKFSAGAIKFSLDGEDEFETFELAHRGKDGGVVHLDLDLESAGTRRLLVILDQTFKAIDAGLPIFIDELDVSLHTHVSEAVLKVFCSPNVNRNGAQLVATTHDTNLMKSHMLRRDQLWFAEKSDEGATVMYPLTDIRTRKGDNVELGYLQGRYGAMPGNDPVAALCES